MKFQYHPEAAGELISIVEYYEDKHKGLGAEFLDEIETIIAQALAHPESGYLLDDKNRRIVLHRFPFELIYQFNKSMLTVLVLKHSKRKPGYWKSRAN